MGGPQVKGPFKEGGHKHTDVQAPQSTPGRSRVGPELLDSRQMCISKWPLPFFSPYL